MELSGANIKKIPIFSQKKTFLIFGEMELFYILGNGNPKKFLIFQETEPFCISENENPEKNSYISGNGTF